MDSVVSFDVIEHVENPVLFMQDVKELLSENGEAVIGTPTDAPVMRELLGSIFEENLLFSTQHLWVFNEQSLRKICQSAGFSTVDFSYRQRYGIDNMISWILEKKAGVKKEYHFITDTLNDIWKRELEAQKMADYILFYVKK